MKNSDNINWLLECEKKINFIMYMNLYCFVMNVFWDNNKRYIFWFLIIIGKLFFSGNIVDLYFVLLDKYEK